MVLSACIFLTVTVVLATNDSTTPSKQILLTTVNNDIQIIKTCLEILFLIREFFKGPVYS